MTNNVNDKSQTLARMKALMNYNHVNESKTPYSSVEYKRLGADGKMYGIIREGAKYYIKSASNKKGEYVKEDFNYIGGFCNRKDNEYDSFANAQKQFDLKMMSIKEAVHNDKLVIESWDLDKKEMVLAEASDKMKQEIMRERQIMNNAKMISEKKGISTEIEASQKSNMRNGESHACGNAKKANKDFKNVKGSSACKDSMCCEEGCSVNESEVLGWHDSNGNPQNDTYMDKSHGTEIGSSAPFNAGKGRDITDKSAPKQETEEVENGVVEEGESMHDTDNQNSPQPGVGEVGDSKPFDEKKKNLKEAIDDLDDDADDEGAVEGDDDALDTDGALGDEEDFDIDGEEEPIDDDSIDDDDFTADDVEDEDISDRLSSLEELMDKIAEKLGISGAEVDEEPYMDDDDDALYTDDEEEDDENIEDDIDFEAPMTESRRGEKYMVFETRGFRKAMRKLREDESRLDDFGKHPAYQKKVMTLPSNDNFKKDGQYDMNDSSVDGEAPYGQSKGDQSPFNDGIDAIEDAITESVLKILKKKLG